jgi:hypothetical protein
MTVAEIGFAASSVEQKRTGPVLLWDLEERFRTNEHSRRV